MLVGFSFPSGGGNPALWYRGAYRFINEMIPADANLQIGVSALNENGEIAGTGLMNTPPFSQVAVLLTPVSAMPGDTNCDEVVNVDDLLVVINAWGSNAPGFADLNGDGTVDVSDLLGVLFHWG